MSNATLTAARVTASQFRSEIRSLIYFSASLASCRENEVTNEARLLLIVLRDVRAMRLVRRDVELEARRDEFIAMAERTLAARL